VSRKTRAHCRAKLIDFETTLPSAVEELVQRRAERQGKRRRLRL